MSKNKSPWSPAVQKIVDELKAKRKDDIRRLTEINKEMLDELEKQRNKHCFASSGVGNCDTCRDKQNCSLLRVINKAKGVQG